MLDVNGRLEFRPLGRPWQSLRAAMKSDKAAVATLAEDLQSFFKVEEVKNSEKEATTGLEAEGGDDQVRIYHLFTKTISTLDGRLRVFILRVTSDLMIFE